MRQVLVVVFAWLLCCSLAGAQDHEARLFEQSVRIQRAAIGMSYGGALLFAGSGTLLLANLSSECGDSSLVCSPGPWDKAAAITAVGVGALLAGTGVYLHVSLRQDLKLNAAPAMSPEFAGLKARVSW